MDGNKICNWLLHYTRQDSIAINSENSIDIESSLLIKQKMCSSISYFECGQVLFDDFPDYSTGFVGIFNYLSCDKRRIMDRLKDEDLQMYINKLKNYNNFSMRHHVTMIKCFMKRYVCHLAPWERIKRALDGICTSTGSDNVLNQDSFRNIQRNLILWLRVASIKGFQRLFKSKKSLSEEEAAAMIDNSTIGSLLLYTLVFYASATMVKYKISLPDISSHPTNGTSKPDFASEHSQIVSSAFADICDNKDVLPLQTDCLISRSMDAVPETLTIALVFHWTFGNSMKNLENLLKMSVSSTKSDYSDSSPSHRPYHLPLQVSVNDQPDSKAFFMTSNRASNNSLRQIFSKAEDSCRRNNGSMVISADGDSSPDIFHTPTEEELPTSFTNSATPPVKLLSFKPINNVLKPISNNAIPEAIPFSLKAEFQKKLQQKQTAAKPKPVVSIIPSNETTWMAQSNKHEAINIPLTPKKSMVSSDSFPQTEYPQSLTKSQLNQIQMQLSLSRQKIEKGKKNLAIQTEKKIEDSKQKVFFQALNKTSKVVRRKSLETFERSPDTELSDADKRLSMYIARTEMNQGVIPLKRFVSKEKLNSFFEVDIGEASGGVKSNTEPNKDNVDKESESPESLLTSDATLLPVEICLDPVSDVLFDSQSSHDDVGLSPQIQQSDDVSDGNLVDIESLSRKNSSPSVSVMSNYSNRSLERNLVTKDDHQKSIDILSTSLTSLQEELRILKQQQHLSCNKEISRPVNKEVKVDEEKVKTDRTFVASRPVNKDEIKVDEEKFKTDRTFVADTPTDCAISSIVVCDSSRQLLKTSISPTTSEVETDSTLVADTPTDCAISPIVVRNSSRQFLQTSISLNAAEVTNPVLSVVPSQFQSLTQISSILPPADDSPNNLDSQIELLRRPSDYFEASNHDSQQFSPSGSLADNDGTDMTSSSESIVVTNGTPVSFVIVDNQIDAEAQKKKAELLAKREQRRILKLEMFRQRRDEERENRLSATNEELLERELKKRLEQEKRDSLLKKYLDRKNEEKTPSVTPPERRSSSTVGTTVKASIKTNNGRASIRGVKQESVENLSLASPQRNGWFSSIRQNHRMTSSSTSNLGATDSTKFGVPLPPQEYFGPKLFGKRKVKTNRSVIANAISHCCLAGSVNVPTKEAVLKDLADAEGTHFMILFRDHRCQYRSLYVFDLGTEDLNLITGTGPKRVTHEMVEKFYKYNSGTKQFNPILSTKHLSPAVDAICIQAGHWSQRPASQGLSGSVATLPRSKR